MSFILKFLSNKSVLQLVSAGLAVLGPIVEAQTQNGVLQQFEADAFATVENALTKLEANAS